MTNLERREPDDGEREGPDDGEREGPDDGEREGPHDGERQGPEAAVFGRCVTPTATPRPVDPTGVRSALKPHSPAPGG